MRILPSHGLSHWLATPQPVSSLADLAAGWRAVEVVLTLSPVRPVSDGFGAHLRRSFLGGLAPAASAPAQAGQPCPWDPPCALDVFLREQLRAGSDGLPKPYVLFWQQEGRVLVITLRIFGTACDWAGAAADGLVTALRDILPWARAVPGQSAAPGILHRQFAAISPALPPDGPLTLRFLSPMDDEGANPHSSADPAARLLSRALRRVDALARWQGLSLADGARRALTDAALALRTDAARLQTKTHQSPNSKAQDRLTQVTFGALDLPRLSLDLRLLLALAALTHVGRHTNEGLGRIEIVERCA